MPEKIRKAKVGGYSWPYRVDEEGNAEIVDRPSPAPSGELAIPGELRGHPVTVIGPKALSDCTELTSVVIPAGVTVIRIGAFIFSGLRKVKIPDGVTVIEDEAFSCTNLSSVTFPDGLESIGENAFYQCDNLKSVTIPRSLKFIDREAFDECRKLKTIKVCAGDVKRVKRLLKESDPAIRLTRLKFEEMDV